VTRRNGAAPKGRSRRATIAASSIRQIHADQARTSPTAQSTAGREGKVARAQADGLPVSAAGLECIWSFRKISNFDLKKNMTTGAPPPRLPDTIKGRHQKKRVDDSMSAGEFLLRQGRARLGNRRYQGSPTFRDQADLHAQREKPAMESVRNSTH